jgi:hypothetical protein
MGNKKLSIIEALQIVTQNIKDWVTKKMSKMATGLIVVDNMLFLKTGDGYMSEHGVPLSQGGDDIFTDTIILDCGTSADVIDEENNTDEN